jgi:hypothetical protein
VDGLDEARRTLRELRPRLEALVAVRAELTELRADLDLSGHSRLGGLPEAKALEAHIFAELESFGEHGAQIRGWAPLLLDFPGVLSGEPVMWCWLEGDQEIDWYHRADCGFAGRRRVPPLG